MATRNNFNRNAFAPKPPRKTNSLASSNPHFLTRRHHVVDREEGLPAAMKNLESIRNIRGTGVHKGNLAVSHLNPFLISGPLMKTNSPAEFPEGLPVRLIPLGGTNEVGLNMTAIECGDDIIIIDTGIGFGDNEKFPGIDYIAPEVNYLEQNRHKIRGLIYTHGHLDHIGAAPYVLPKLGPIPIFSMPLTLALLKNRMSEFEIEAKFSAKIINLNEVLTLGCFNLQFFRLNHSICDVIGLCIDTPMGRIVYCTDWKFDSTPFDGQISDYGKLAKFGDEGVRLLLTDSLGILKPGSSLSEMDVCRTMFNIFAACQERVIVTSFSTTTARMQFTVDACVKYGRKLALVGRSMINNFNVCFKLGYIKVPPDLIVDIKDIGKLEANKVCILSTGSQGEDLAVLARLARDEHPTLKLQGGDSVIFSSRPIEGNEGAVENLKAGLSRKGVMVYDNREFSLHVGGHACVEDLKLLFALTKPDYLQPIHGDHYIIRKTAELGLKMGIPYEHNLICENGRVTELRAREVVVTEEVVNEGYLLVDGTSVGSVSESVLEERRQMATQGSIVLVITVNKARKIVSGPEIISRGFVYMKNNGELLENLKIEISRSLENLVIDPASKSYFSELRGKIRDIASDYINDKIEKNPMIIPVVVQI
jgi:ribonuclease J